VSLALLMTVGCDIGNVTTEASVHSGVHGVTRVGPMCPVQFVQKPCPDRPLMATVAATRAGSSTAVATTKSDRNGQFTLTLKPGRYLLVASSSTLMPGHQDVRRNVTITRDHFTTVVLAFDSGIR
jgi:hypothetical protein